MRSKPLTATERQGIRGWLRRDPHWTEQHTMVLLDRFEATCAALEAKVADLKADNRGLTEARVTALRMCSEMQGERDAARADVVIQQQIAGATQMLLDDAEQRATRLAGLETAARAVRQTNWDAWEGLEALMAAVAALPGGATPR